MKLICHDDTRFTREFAEGANAPITNIHKQDLVKLKKKGYTVAFTGFGRMKLIIKLEAYGIPYFFIDRGYIIDDGKKQWMRVCYNSFQMERMRDFSSWRRGIKIKPKSWKKNGDYILVVPPCAKAGRYWGFDNKKWLESTVTELREYSNRDILIRARPIVRDRYEGSKSLVNAAKNAHCIVAYNSNAATEAIFHGTPAIVLGEAASKFVSAQKLSNVEKLIRPDRTEWIKNLMYNQFSREELTSGAALKALIKMHNLK
jgi:hypothetical protein